MAAKSIKYPLSHAAKRSFAAQAAVKQSEPLPTPEVVCTKMPNKLLVSTLDVGGPLSRVSVVFRTGPRNETEKTRGIVHVIRSMAGFSTQRCTGFAVIRNLQQEGIHFTCTGDREITAFNVVGARNKINCALKYLSAVTSAPAFKPWQVKDNNPRLLYEIGTLSPQARTMDILHKAAYRTGLGNSLFIKKDHVGNHTPEMLMQFYKESFTANRACVSGINVHQHDLIEFSKSLTLECNDPPEGNGKYFGGEIRKDKASYFAHVAIATESVGMKDVKEALVYTVLQHAYGVQPVIRWGGSPSPLYKATYPAAPDAGVSCFSVNYNETGLFGFVVSSSAATAGKAVEAAFKVIKSGAVSEADVKRAKALVKMNILDACENSGNLIDDIGGQSLYGGVVIPGPVLAEALDKISVSDVANAAKKVANGKFSLAGFGNLDEVPYLDQLR